MCCGDSAVEIGSAHKGSRKGWDGEMDGCHPPCHSTCWQTYLDVERPWLSLDRPVLFSTKRLQKHSSHLVGAPFLALWAVSPGWAFTD